MAKYKPTHRQATLYDKLLKQQNKLRKRLIRQRKELEESTGVGRLPDLVIPSKAHTRRNVNNYSFDSYEEFRRKLKALTNLYGYNPDNRKTDPLLRWYKLNYKDKILELWREKIADVGDRFGAGKLDVLHEFGHEGGRYTQAEIDRIRELGGDVSRLADYMEAYNELVGMRIAQFMDAYNNSYFPKYQFIYNDLEKLGVGESGFLEQLVQGIKDYKRDFAFFGKGLGKLDTTNRTSYTNRQKSMVAKKKEKINK